MPAEPATLQPGDATALPETTRTRLLDAAAERFAFGGFHGTSVDEVARAAGLTKGAVYANFRSKEELFLALLDRNVTEIVSLLESLLTQPVDDRLQALPARLAQATVLGPAWTLLELEFVLYAARNPRLQAVVRGRRDRTRHLLASVVARHLEDVGHRDPAADADAAADLISATADGLAFAALTDPEVAVAERLTDLVALLTDPPD